MINTALLPADKDPMGAAIADYFKRHKADRLRVFSSQSVSYTHLTLPTKA